MDTEELPWYRHWMLWLVIAIPALTVPAGLVTLAVALRGADEVVTDDYRVEPLGVKPDSARDAAARVGDVHATLVVASDGSVTATLRQGSASPPAQLVLRLSHATRSSEDRTVRLAPSGTRSFRGELPPLAAGHWYVELAPPDGAWRLTSEFRAPLQQLSLEPRPGP
jgi:hypothetical protein